MWKKYDALMWEAGHKTVSLFKGASTIPLHTILRMAGDGIQTQHDQVPNVKRVSVTVRNSLEFIQCQEQQESKVIPSQEVGVLSRGLIYEPSNPILLEGLEEIKGLLKEGTPISCLQKTLEEELWEEEQFQRGNIPIPQVFKRYGTI